MREDLGFDPEEWYKAYCGLLKERRPRDYEELSDYSIHELMDIESQKKRVDDDFMQKCVDVLTKYLYFSPHNTKYAFSDNMLKNPSCHPYIMQIYEYAAHDFIAGHDDGNYDVVFMNYGKFREVYLAEGYPEAEVFKHPKIKEYIDYGIEDIKRRSTYIGSGRSENRESLLKQRLKDNQELCFITGNFVDIDGTLIQRNGDLNTKLYDAMLNSNETIYIFTGEADLDKQRKRLANLGVDLNRFAVLPKSYLADKNKIIAGTIVDDTNPVLQRLQILSGKFYKHPDQMEEDFAFNHKNEVRQELAKYERGCRAFSLKEKMYMEILEESAKLDRDFDDMLYGHVPPTGAKALEMLKNMDEQGHDGQQYKELAAKIASGRLLNDRPYNNGWQPTDAQHKGYAIDTLKYLTLNKKEWCNQNPEIYSNLIHLCASSGLAEKTARLLTKNNKEWCENNADFFNKILYTATFEPKNRIYEYISQLRTELMDADPEMFTQIALRSKKGMDIVEDILQNNPQWRENNPKQYMVILAKAAAENSLNTLEFLSRNDTEWLKAHDDIHSILIMNSKEYKKTLNFVENFDKEWIAEHPYEHLALKFRVDGISSETEFIKQNPESFVDLVLDTAKFAGGKEILEKITQNEMKWCREHPELFDKIVEGVLELEPFTDLEVKRDGDSSYLTLSTGLGKASNYYTAYHGKAVSWSNISEDHGSYFRPIMSEEFQVPTTKTGDGELEQQECDPNKREYQYKYGAVVGSNGAILPDGSIISAQIIQDERWIETKPYGGGDHWNWSVNVVIDTAVEQEEATDYSLCKKRYQTASYRVRGENADEDCWENNKDIKFRVVAEGVEVILGKEKELTVDLIPMKFGENISIKELSEKYCPHNHETLQQFKETNHIRSKQNMSALDIYNYNNPKTH